MLGYIVTAVVSASLGAVLMALSASAARQTAVDGAIEKFLDDAQEQRNESFRLGRELGYGEGMKAAQRELTRARSDAGKRAAETRRARTATTDYDGQGVA